MIISGTFSVIGIVVGTIAGIALATGGGMSFVNNNRSAGRMERFQRRVEVGGKISPDSNAARRKLKKHIKKQRKVMKFGVRDLQMRVNSVKSKTKANLDESFERIWVLDRVSGNVRKLYRCKAKEVIQDLKGKTLIHRKSASLGIPDVMKTNGFMKAPIVNAGKGGTYLIPVAQTLENTYHGCTYQMASEIVGDESSATKFDPCGVFGKILKRNIKKCGMRFPGLGQTFSRYSIDYPEVEGGRPSPDRFVLGCNNTSNVMFNASKILMIAKACSKFNQHRDLGKVRVIEGVGDGVQVDIKTRAQFRAYVNDFMAEKSFKKGLKEIENIDPSAANYIQHELRDFVEARVYLESEILEEDEAVASTSAPSASTSAATASASAASVSSSTATASTTAETAPATADIAPATADIAFETMDEESYFATPAIEPTVIYDAPIVRTDIVSQAKELLECGFTKEQVAEMLGGKGRD